MRLPNLGDLRMHGVGRPCMRRRLTSGGVSLGVGGLAYWASPPSPVRSFTRGKRTVKQEGSLRIGPSTYHADGQLTALGGAADSHNLRKASSGTVGISMDDSQRQALFELWKSNASFPAVAAAVNGLMQEAVSRASQSHVRRGS